MLSTDENIVEFIGVNNYKNNRMNGTIKTILSDKGFGFISREGETKDIFFHSKELKDVAFEDLKIGDEVTFEITEGDKGPAATNVTRV